MGPLTEEQNLYAHVAVDSSAKLWVRHLYHTIAKLWDTRGSIPLRTNCWITKNISYLLMRFCKLILELLTDNTKRPWQLLFKLFLHSGCHLSCLVRRFFCSLSSSTSEVRSMSRATHSISTKSSNFLLKGKKSFVYSCQLFCRCPLSKLQKRKFCNLSMNPRLQRNTMSLSLTHGQYQVE